MTFEELDKLVISWGIDKDLIKRENADKQFMKFIEEVFEFRDELTKISYMVDMKKQLQEQGFNLHVDESFIRALKLEMGDILVTLIILSAQLDIDLTECLERAYNKISKRKGKTIDGIFVKEEDL